MVTYNALRIQQIVDDPELSKDSKIIQLSEIESEARALERAASEGPMNPNDGWDDDLRLVRKALEKLGWTEPKKGAASL
jgi:hypothetical protein